jgi:hypothetical protein
MATKRIYISCPISVDESILYSFHDVIDDETNFLASSWKRGTYYTESYLLHSDAVVFILPRVQFDCNITSLPTGVKSELDLAIKNNKPIFIGYITRNGEPNIYNARIVGNTIGGVACTSGKIFNHDFELNAWSNFVKNYEEKERVVAVLDPIMDKRLLLML